MQDRRNLRWRTRPTHMLARFWQIHLHSKMTLIGLSQHRIGENKKYQKMSDLNPYFGGDMISLGMFLQQLERCSPDKLTARLRRMDAKWLTTPQVEKRDSWLLAMKHRQKTRNKTLLALLIAIEVSCVHELRQKLRTILQEDSRTHKNQLPWYYVGLPSVLHGLILTWSYTCWNTGHHE